MEYVWGLHDFAREHEDEIDFKAGDRILVVEKDDQYQDGWWKGTNPAGQTGLFPMSYTALQPPGVIPMAPASQILGGHLHPLAEESDSQAGDHEEHQAPRGPGSDTVMNATMTDIQEAIEQLGVQDSREDASRSFSFASTKDGNLTDEEGKSGIEHYDARDARTLLAQNAFRQNTQKSSKTLQSHHPPIQVEMSDESEDEEGPSPRQQIAAFPHNAPMLHSTKDFTESPMSNLQSPLVLQETIKEESEQEEGPPSEQQPLAFANGHTRHDTVTTIQPIPTVKGETEEPRTLPDAPATVFKANTVERVIARSTSPLDKQQVTENVPIAEFSGEEAPQLSPPGPASSSPTKSQAPSISSFRPPYVSQDIARASSPLVVASPANLSVELGNVSPGDWSVDQVVTWLKSRSFDDSICAKFAEHEISGDVLLELDLNMLKELEIQAFGKRMKIAHAISDLKNDLKQPDSAFSSAPSTHFPQGQSPLQQSSPYDHTRNPSAIMYSPEGIPHVNDFATSSQYGLPISAPVPVHANPSGRVMTNELEGMPTDGRAIGLGVVDAEATKKHRPVSLSLSPSDGALSAKVLRSAHSKKTSTSSAAISQASDGGDKDRYATTDTESAPTSLRVKAKRGFMRSASRDRALDSDGTSILPSPSLGSRNGSPTTEKTTQHKAKRNSDPTIKSSTDTHRHSFFGATLGKSRKPAPRYSESSQDISPTSTSYDKVPRSISRLHLSGSTKRSRANENGISSETKPASSPKNVLEVSPTAQSPAQSPAYRERPVSVPLDKTFLQQIGEFDHDGWMRKKGERYSSWKLRYFVLRGPHLYYLRGKGEAKIKGYINIKGYRIIADENIYPGRYGFRIVHDTSASHYFSSDEQITIREWMKALMKATIVRDYTKAVISSVNMPTIPLSVAQTMSPPPRPPSPAARDATQRAMRRENTSQLSSRDTRVLMGLSPENRLNPNVSDATGDSTTLGGDGSTLGPPTPHVDHTPRAASAPVRPMRRQNENSVKSVPVEAPQDVELLKWVNLHLKGTKLKATDLSASLSTGLILYRVAERIKGIPYGSEVADSAFPTMPTDEKLDGLFILFDFLLDNDIRMGSVSINDVRQGNHEKLVQLVKSLKSWEEKTRELERTMYRGTSGAMYPGPLMGAP